MKMIRWLFIWLAINFSSDMIAQPPTKILIFQAYVQNSTLNPNISVAQQYKGNCWTRSLANPNRTDAWRCQASNLILDPCFEDGTSVACIVSPWSGKAAIVELDNPLFKRPFKKIDPRSAQPWAIELANGQRCIFLTGASTVINNQRMNYFCQHSRSIILGYVDKSNPTWKASLYNFDSKTINPIDVTTAWF